MKRTMEKARILLARFMAMVMLLGIVLPVLPVLADGETMQGPENKPITVEDGDMKIGDVPVTNPPKILDGDLNPNPKVTDAPVNTALDVSSKTSASEFEVDGNVSLKNTRDNVNEVTAVKTTASGEKGDSDVLVTKDVNAEGNGNKVVTAVDTSAQNGGSAETKVEGSANAASSDGNAVAVTVSAEGKGSTAAAEVDGKAVASSDSGKETAVEVKASQQGKAEAKIGEGAEGQVRVEAQGGAAATLKIESGGVTAEVVGGGVYIDNKDSTVTVDISGEVEVEGFEGIRSDTQIREGKTAETDITVNGNITATGGGNGPGGTDSAIGVLLSTKAEGTVTNAAVTGDITAKATDGSSGVELNTQYGSEINLTLTGDIVSGKAEGTGNAIGALVVNDGGTLTYTQTGDITATGNTGSGMTVVGNTDYHFEAVEADVHSSPYDGTEEPQEEAKKIHITTTDGTVTNYADVYSTGTGDGKKYYTKRGEKYYQIDNVEKVIENTSETEVTVTGNVTSDECGLVVVADEDAKADIIVDGTVNGKKASVVLASDTQLGDDVTVTVWQVVPDENNNVVFTKDETEGGTVVTAADEETQKQIQYIIRIKAGQEDIIGTTGTTDFQGYRVAREGDTVTMKLNIPDGYEVTEAFGKDDGVVLEKDAKGDYYLTVKRGGGYELSVTLTEKKREEPDGGKDEAEEKPAETEEAGADTVMITYVLDNGAQNDHIRTTAAVGGKITLQPAPEREGYTFLYWKGSDVDINSPYYKEPNPDADFQFHPGATYNVKRAYNFVAVWKKN